MSRSRKKKPREFYRGTKIKMCCPRGRCSWCDDNRQHSNLTNETYADQAIEEFVNLPPDWDDYD